MSYRCGIGRGMEALGFEEGPPRVMCDCCGFKLVIRGDRLPPKWLLDNRPAPKWRMHRQELADGSIYRLDVCPRCADPAEIIRLVVERDNARADARLLAHAYRNGEATNGLVLNQALDRSIAYPAIPKRIR